MFKYRGLTLLELLITISVLVLLVSLGSPVFSAIQKNIQLKGVVENHYFAFQQARHAAISKGSDVVLSFQGGKHWCVGISELGKCDCKALDNCTLNGVEHLISFRDYSHILLADIKFGKDNTAVFDGVRGLSIGHAGSVTFSDGDRQLKLILSNMGRVRICGITSTVGSYQKC